MYYLVPRYVLQSTLQYFVSSSIISEGVPPIIGEAMNDIDRAFSLRNLVSGTVVGRSSRIRPTLLKSSEMYFY